MHICVGNLAINGSDYGLSPGRCRAIILTSAGILLIGPLGTNFREILIEILKFSFINAFESIVCEMAAILSRSQYVNKRCSVSIITLRRLHFKFPCITFTFTTLISVFDCFIGLAPMNPDSNIKNTRMNGNLLYSILHHMYIYYISGLLPQVHTLRYIRLHVKTHL